MSVQYSAIKKYIHKVWVESQIGDLAVWLQTMFLRHTHWNEAFQIVPEKHPAIDQPSFQSEEGVFRGGGGQCKNIVAQIDVEVSHLENVSYLRSYF